MRVSSTESAITASNLLRHSAYYLVMGISLGLFFSDFPYSLHAKALIAILAGGLLITLGEYLLPFRKEWQGLRRDSWDDALYMILVQQVLLRLVQAAWVYFLLQILSLNPLRWTDLWAPVPLALQFATLLLLGEFGKYWVHRWAHEVEWLWRFHAVHHSVDRIYWLNVGRFHPVDKFLQMFTESLLFYLLGAPMEVLALYEVFYSVNGFFQHSNIDLRMGWMNRVISSVEQHRYHHSRAIHESNTNYGNKLSIYDQLFGTYHLPDSAGPREYGLINPTYPMSFWGQTWAPFFRDLDQRGFLSPKPLRSLLLREALKLRVRLQGWLSCWQHRWAARDLRRAQLRLLRRILATQAGTQFGIDHGFGGIRTLEQFQERVPIQNYEDLRPYLMRQDSEGVPALTSEEILFFAMTSGTTDLPKFIPVTRSQLKRYRHLQNLWLHFIVSDGIPIFDGHILSIVGDAVEGSLPSGKTYGSTSGHIYRTLPRLVRELYVLPSQIFSIRDHSLKYSLMVRLAVEDPFISMINTANPSTLNMLQKLTHSYGQRLIDDIREGTFHRCESLSGELQELCRTRFRPNPRRADELQRILEREKGALPFEEIWPSLKVVSCWQSAGCRLAFEAFKKTFRSRTIQWRDLGYLSSEFRGTIPFQSGRAEGLPTFLDYFYEFIPLSQENASPLGIWDLVEGEKYSILVTSFNGLYRYFMNDIVEAHGRLWGVPLLRFVQKGRGVTSITGEKLHESQFLLSVENIRKHLSVTEAVALADPETSSYLILIETPETQVELAALLDQELGRLNVEYRSKRDSGRLQPPRVLFMKPGFFDELRLQLAIKNAQGRDAQVKVIGVQYLQDFPMKFSDWVRS